RVRNSSRHAVLDAKQDSFETGPAGPACQEPHRIPEPLSSDDPLQAAGKGKRDRGRDAGRSRGTRQGAGLPHRRRRRNSGSVTRDRKSTRLNSSHVAISYAVFCLKKKKYKKPPSKLLHNTPHVYD